MTKKYRAVIPRVPFLKRRLYNVPKTYLEAYHKAGVKDPDAVMMLFHLTQFGGFRLREIPQDMFFDKSFLDEWCKQEHDGYYHVKPNPHFLQVFGGLAIKPLEREWSIDVLNEEDMAENGFSELDIEASQDFLYALNEFYASLRLYIPMPQSGITADDRIKLSRFNTIPFLVKKPKAGGRFFHPGSSYQRVSSSLRRTMTINGRKTGELDLSAAVIQFLDLALKSRSLGSLESLLTFEDPYDYFLSHLNAPGFLKEHGEQPISRDDLKKLLYTAIYSTTNRQESQVNRKLKFMGKQYRHEHLCSFFPAFFEALAKIRNSTQQPLHHVIYREESAYAQAVLQRSCLDKKMPVLPIHDSFIAKSKDIQRLARIMEEVATELYRKPLLYKQKY